MTINWIIYNDDEVIASEPQSTVEEIPKLPTCVDISAHVPACISVQGYVPPCVRIAVNDFTIVFAPVIAYFDNSGSMTTTLVEETDETITYEVTGRWIEGLETGYFVLDKLSTVTLIGNNIDMCDWLKDNTPEDGAFIIYDSYDPSNTCEPDNSFDITSNNVGTYNITESGVTPA